jgi:hypothetical protein
MAKVASVAYENSREAKRKLKALKPLRWHREAEGRYVAKGARGSYTVFKRSPDRRHGIFPWSARQGGMKGPEVKIGGFDLKEQAKEFVALFDAGLCGAPAGVPGVFSGTLASEDVGPRASAKYIVAVTKALGAMGVNSMEGGDATDMVRQSMDYVARMESAGIDASTVAAVLFATKEHAHLHDCAGKHVELAEGSGAAEGSKREHHIFRGQRVDIFKADGSWWYELSNGTGQGGFISKDQAWGAAQRMLGMPSGFSIAVEGAAEAKRKKRGLAPDDWMIPSLTLQQRLDQGPPGLGAYPTVNWAPFHIYYLDRPHGMVVEKYQSGPDAQGALNNFRLEGYKNDVVKITDVFIKDGPHDGGAVFFVDKSDQVYPRPFGVDEGGAAESKKRLWQPDPTSGLFITKSSFTRDYFVMKGKHLLERFTTRPEAEDYARRYVENGPPKA